MAATITTTATQAHCLRCGRVLTDPRSIARGYGPVCARRIGHAAQIIDLSAWKAEQATKAMDLITTGAIVPTATGYLAVSSDGTVRYETTTHTCTCPAGQHGRRCYHIAAATILAAA